MIDLIMTKIYIALALLLAIVNTSIGNKYRDNLAGTKCLL